MWDLGPLSSDQTRWLEIQRHTLFHTFIPHFIPRFPPRTIRVWRPSEGSCVGVLEGHEGPVLSLAVSPTGVNGLVGVAGGDAWDVCMACMLVWAFVHGMFAWKVSSMHQTGEVERSTSRGGSGGHS